MLVIPILILLLSAIHASPGRSLDIFSHKISENTKAHGSRRVTIAGDARFSDNARAEQATARWEDVKRQRGEEKMLTRLKEKKIRLERELQGVNDQEEQRRLRAQVSTLEKRLRRRSAPVEPRLGAMMVSRDHIITYQVWREHLINISGVDIDVSRKQAQELSDSVINGRVNLIGMRSSVNRDVKGILESEKRFQGELQRVQQTKERIMMARRQLVDDIPKWRGEYAEFKRVGGQFSAVGKYLHSQEYKQSQQRVMQKYEEWLRRIGVEESVALQVVQDLHQRVLAFDELMSQRAATYRQEVSDLRALLRPPQGSPRTIPEHWKPHDYADLDRVLAEINNHHH